MNSKLQLRKQISGWLPVLASFIIPGSGYVILGKPLRGLMMLFWMLLFGFITFQLTSENISPVGRFSGGIAIWTLSILEVARISARSQNGIDKKKNAQVKKSRR
ncbi:hypothetical protein [Candidatus Formimonas warabiya]|uniref:DUF5683 domain-containing protein n=1 Tax=Formimonas warabiya TaxID=1761012 RepID=A0A3G1KS69_FORW1|nr:hypothetical protein [Candidatus Formimonas warabiya]ATW25309.1 hypothetical protein DCMF_11490 [Candidatus Formimonas warabiya]